MQLHPTRTAVDVAIAAIVAVGVGLVARKAPIVAWGGAILLGLCLARAVTLVSVARIRAAGFEMLWDKEPRLRRVARGEIVEIHAEVRNRDSRAARYVELRPVASPDLDVTIEPGAGEVPAGGRLRVVLRCHTPRVGRHGVHGLSLEVQGSPGLFEVPLTFANPYGIEVLPHAYATGLRTARGGRSRMAADEGRPGPLSGDGSELRELREYRPGDPFKKIAWRPSARRARLLVRDFEREERDVVWLVLDASVELWAGRPGTAPLDAAIDEVAAVAQRHLARGDRVGLAIVGARVLARLLPDRGVAHGAELMSALALATGTLDADRSDLDEQEVAQRVLEHLRPLDPAAAARLRPSDLDRVARRAERARARGPFAPLEPHAPTQRERMLRAYLAAFGIGSPARQEPERQKTDPALAHVLAQIVRDKPRASVAYVWSSVSDAGVRPVVEEAIRRHPRRRVELLWVPIRQGASIPRGERGAPAAVAAAMGERTRVAEARGEQALRRLGVRIAQAPPHSATLARHSVAPPPSPAESSRA